MYTQGLIVPQSNNTHRAGWMGLDSVNMALFGSCNFGEKNGELTETLKLQRQRRTRAVINDGVFGSF